MTDARPGLSSEVPDRSERAGPAPEPSYTEASFDDFFEVEAPTLFRRLCLVTGNRAEAEDVMQEAFLKLYERWGRVRALDDPVGYLYRTAFNTFKRRSSRAAMALKRTITVERRVDEFSAADARSVVTAALATLTPRQRAAVILTELLGYDSTEAGRILGIRPGTVRALSFQARGAMRRAVGDPDG